ncbi:hypothetical protein RhiJN_06645 [Ceratobasidium sp. AG-Ba]|nr:hypothetical protein RhiJN_06645 [Ceratobasidium sp. AG-Ba]
MRLVVMSLAFVLAALAKREPPKLSPISKLPVTPNTNAERFALGMPPLKPKLRRHHIVLGTRVASAPRAQISPMPYIHVTCNILATFLNGTTFGYLSPTWNENHTYYEFQPTQAGSLSLSFSYEEEHYQELSLQATNGPAANSEYPYFGAVLVPEAVDDNFVPVTKRVNSYDDQPLANIAHSHAYLAGTIATPPGSPAVTGLNSFNNNQHIQTAIWVYGSGGGGLIPQWINPDDSRFGRFPATNIVQANHNR